MGKFLLLFIFLLSLVACKTVPVEVRYNFDGDADFSKFKTYKWVTLKDAATIDDFRDKQIKAVVDAELARKGMDKTDADTADLYLGYQAGVDTQRQFTSYMTVFDLDQHAVIASLPMPGGPDVIKFDPGLGRIYVACCSGAIAVFHEDDPDHYRKLEDFHVQHAVHSLAIDPATHRVYAPEQEEDGKPVARMVVYEAINH